MIPDLPRRIAAEAAPAALALVCWAFLVRLAPPALQGSLTLVALTLAVLYAAARGRALADAVPGTPMAADARAVLVENLQAGLAAGVWLLAAVFVYALRALWDGLGVPGAFTDPSSWLASAFGGAAVVAVVIYAVARWTAMERTARSSGGGPSTAPIDRASSGASSDD